MREHIDQFFWGRGSEVLSKVHKKAAETDNADVVAMLEGLAGFVSRLLTNQFHRYPKGDLVPQPEMLREMLRMWDEPDTTRLFAYVDEHLDAFDGHFFMSISESLRHSRAHGDEGNLIILPMLGRLVAFTLLQHGHPCSFAILFQP